MYSSLEMPTREEAQAAIREVCKKRGLQYTLDFEYEKGERTKIRIAYVKPENLLDYRHLLVAGNRWRIEAQDVVEEEAMLEIWHEGNKWEHKIAWTKTLPTGDTVIGDIKADIRDILSEHKSALKKLAYSSAGSTSGRRHDEVVEDKI